MQMSRFLVASGIMMLVGPASAALMPRLTRLHAEGQHQAVISVYRQATQHLFSGAFDVHTVIIMKDVYDDLENTVDRCEHVGDLVERIVIKNT